MVRWGVDRRHRMQRSFQRELSSLAPLFEFANEAAQRYAFGEDVLYAVNLAIEEIFTNMVKYGGGDATISALIEVRGREVVVELVHPGAVPFDVTASGEVDVSRPLDERLPGGIGLFLVHRVMDDVTYQHENGAAHVTLKKRLGGG